MDDIKEMVLFFKYAKRNNHLTEVVKQLQSREENEDVHEIKRQQLVSLCQTRFVERHEAVLVARQLLPFVVKSLEDMVTWNSPGHTEECQTTLEQHPESGISDHSRYL
jgi:poly(A) polymerase Pap1